MVSAKVPAAHWLQALRAKAPAYRPRGHCWQSEALDAEAMDPGAHGEQGPPAGPANPASQRQLYHHDDRAGALLLAGHWFWIPVQHQVLAPHPWHAALATPTYPRSQ